jgi:carbon-monoxide dehydrogenase medium subunit
MPVCGTHRRTGRRWLTPPGTSLDAELDPVGPGGRRTVAAADFFTGPFTTVRRQEEPLAEVRVPVLPEHTVVGFSEHRRTHASFASSPR